MDIIRAYSRCSLAWIIFFISLLCVLLDSVLHFALNIASERLMFLFVEQANANLPQTKVFIDQIAALIDILRIWFVPVSTGFFFLFGLMLWFFLYRSFVKQVKKLDIKNAGNEAMPAMKAHVDKKEKKQKETRLFLHLLSVLQREGRLMDFLSEDLDAYEDDQIGAAVRNIHENCKKVVDKYLTTRAVVSEQEEDEITVQPDFDPNAIKLTGNVTGEPPFKGIVRHRGWKVERLDMPTLSSARDPNIIAPAEIEIL